jgi:hypothetical protein
MKFYWKTLNAAHEVGLYSLRLTYKFNKTEALHDLLPQNAQLHFRQAIAHATMDAKAE